MLAWISGKFVHRRFKYSINPCSTISSIASVCSRVLSASALFYRSFSTRDVIFLSTDTRVTSRNKNPHDSRDSCACVRESATRLSDDFHSSIPFTSRSRRKCCRTVNKIIQAPKLAERKNKCTNPSFSPRKRTNLRCKTTVHGGPRKRKKRKNVKV